MRPVKAIVLGATGMLGHQVLAQACKDDRFEALGTVRTSEALNRLPPRLHHRAHLCDVTDENQICDLLAREEPEIVINCVGIVKQIAKDPIEVIAVNSLAPHWIARHCDSIGAKLIQISTDCVFSGSKGNYSEDDLPDPSDIYGCSKLLGEVNYGAHITLRTSFIGRELGMQRGLLEWFLAQRGAVKGYRRAIWSGLTTPALARLLLALALRPDLSGLWHVGGEAIDKYRLLLKLQAAFSKDDVVIESVDQPVIDRSLDSSRFAQTGLRIPPLDEMIAELAREEDSA